ncbi:MAG: 6-phosphogluconolactonase [Idiomarina sp.]|nr:6-phosphogluconolactonase [Idiomarina sp.]
MSTSVHKFSQEHELTVEFANRIRFNLEQAVNARGHGYLVVSGGRTPIALFERLAHHPLPWSDITVLLADDRWVPKDHEASNERLVKQHLFQHQAKAANWLSLNTEHATPAEAVPTLAERLADLPRFDVVILGLGEDGHTASLFPESPQLHQGMTTSQPVVAVTPAHAPHERISLSKSRLLNSRQIYFHLVGQAKADVLDLAMQPGAKFPASAFLQQEQVPVDVMLAVPEE